MISVTGNKATPCEEFDGSRAMKMGIIGGSGLYDMAGLAGQRSQALGTPFGEPSDEYLTGSLHGRDLVFLPRHGRGHRYLPSEINHRANIYGFKALGVTTLLSFSAVGSLREEIRPRDILLPDQYFDRTKQNHTYFGKGVTAHIPFGDPVCPALHRALDVQARRLHPGTVHTGGTYVNMEGPAFSTRAESEAYRALGFHVIGMTSLPEAKLAREAGLCYAPVALVTDYDCWHSSEDVSVELVVENLQANIQFAQSLISAIAELDDIEDECACARALEGAVMTDDESIPEEARKRLAIILGP